MLQKHQSENPDKRKSDLKVEKEASQTPLASNFQGLLDVFLNPSSKSKVQTAKTSSYGNGIGSQNSPNVAQPDSLKKHPRKQSINNGRVRIVAPDQLQNSYLAG